jgi:exodeoxyribonuclease VII large subunit
MSAIPPDAVFSVAEFLDLTNELIKPLRVTVQGEVTSVTPRGRTIFFSVSDPSESAKLECVMWQYRYQQLGFDLVEGAEVKLVGQPNIYKPMGKFSFVVDYASPVGEGALKKAYELLKQNLAQAGFFDPERKQALPAYPHQIGLLTSKNGDAIKDFRTHLGKFGYQILHQDVRVEGVAAIDSIVSAIEWFNQQARPVEVLVLTRGGGSLESLQAFNSEAVAKAIFASKIPVVSAVGHENDVTIADLVADVRASTPTDAGKILSQQWQQAETTLGHYQRTMIQAMSQTIAGYRRQYLTYWQSMVRSVRYLFDQFAGQQRQFGFSLKSFQRSLSQRRAMISELLAGPMVRYQHQLVLTKQQLASFHQQLALSDPQLKLKQGYSIAFDQQGKVIKSTRQAVVGQEISLKVYDGTLKTVVY